MLFTCEFPRDLSFLAIGGGSFNTQVNEGFSGDEQRNRNWSLTRGEWTVALNFKPQAYFDALQSFALVVGGQADSFLFYDAKDHTGTAQLLGYGDGSTTVFQLIKTYTCGGRSYVRTINHPICSSVNDFQGNALGDTVVIHVGDTLLHLGTDFTVDASTGLVTLATAPAGSPPYPIYADFEFHFCVRFLADVLKAQVEESDVVDGDILVSCDAIEIREVKPGSE